LGRQIEAATPAAPGWFSTLLAQAFGPALGLPDMVRTMHAGHARPPPGPPHEQRLPR